MTRVETGKNATYKQEGSRKELQEDPEFGAAFRANIERVKNMEVLFVEENSHTVQYLAELYACLAFKLPTDEFETS